MSLGATFLHYKLISTGHDLHDRFAVADHATITGPHLSSAASAAEPTPSASTRLLEGELEGVEYALGVSYSDSRNSKSRVQASWRQWLAWAKLGEVQ